MDLPQKYPAKHYEIKASRYRAAVSLLFGVHVDRQTEEAWRDLIRLGRGIDTYLDESREGDIFERTARTKRLLDDQEKLAQAFPALGPQYLDKNRYEHVRKLGVSILRLNLAFKTTTCEDLYLDLRREEGRVYADLISGVATPETAGQPGYRAYRWLLRPTGEITNYVNSFRGIAGEYLSGEIAVRPTPGLYVKLLGRIALAAGEVIPAACRDYRNRHDGEAGGV